MFKLDDSWTSEDEASRADSRNDKFFQLTCDWAGHQAKNVETVYGPATRQKTDGGVLGSTLGKRGIEKLINIIHLRKWLHLKNCITSNRTDTGSKV